MSDELEGRKKNYHDTLAKRFKEPPPPAPAPEVTDDKRVLSEKAVDYIYRAVDRQINKARGVLAFNGLLFASFGLIARNSTDTFILTTAYRGAILALLSSLLLLYLMIFDLGNHTDYASTQSDFTAAFKAMWRRRLMLKISLLVTLVATGFAILLPVYFVNELHSGQIPH